MSQHTCPRCGATTLSKGSCGACGAAAVAEAPVVPTGSPNASVRVTAAEIPSELWLVVALFAVPGAWLVIHALDALPDSLKLIGDSFLGFRLGLALTLLVVLVGAMGAGMLWIAWALYRLDRVGRGLAYVVAGTVAISVIFGGGGGAANVAALLGSLAGAAILGLSPAVRAAYTGPMARDHAVPTSVIVSRVTLTIFCAFGAVGAFADLLFATVSARYGVVGVGLLAVVAAALVLSSRLMMAERAARMRLSIGAGAFVVLALILGKFAPGLLIPVGLLGGAIAALWLPNDARTFFGDRPLDLTPLGGA